MKNSHTHYGLACALTAPLLCQAIQRVLRQIRQRAPEDFGRLTTLVQAFVPFPAPGRVARRGVPGMVALSDYIQHPVAFVAHTLGHLCVRDVEAQARQEELLGGWAYELAADCYAYRWGLGRAIARSRRARIWAPRGIGPGHTFSICDAEGVWWRYRVTRRFLLQPLPPESCESRPASVED